MGKNYEMRTVEGKKTKNNEGNIKILKKIFGIVSISPAIKIETIIEKITKKSLSITKNLLSKKNSLLIICTFKNKIKFFLF